MTLKELEETIPTLKNEQLLNLLDRIANEHGVGSFMYCTVKGEIYRRLEGKGNE